MSPSDAAHPTVAGLSEEAIIAAVTTRCPTRPSPYGPGDDAALLDAGERRVLTTDALVEGTHFLRPHPPRALGHKALAVNLSDVAAMGATAEAFTLTAALPPELPIATWHALAEGLGAYAAQAGVYLAGGDTVRADGPLMLSVTAWGRLPAGADPLRRQGGEPGDLLMVAGAIGRAGLGLERWLALTDEAATRRRWAPPDRSITDPLLAAHLAPEPPLWAGPWALAHGAHAGMDLSDGLATDLPRLAAASGVTLAVDLDHLPPDALLGDLDPPSRAAHGEDYGLVALVPPAARDAFAARGFVAIGRAQQSAEPGRSGVLWRLGGRELSPVVPRFSHFA